MTIDTVVKKLEKQAAVCDGKVAWTSKSSAMKAKKGLARRHKQVFTVYRCPVGDHYHLTTRKG